MSSWRVRRVAPALAMAACALSLLGHALGREPASSQKAPSFLTELGAPAAEKLLTSDASRDRLRGLARLSALGTPRAVELLARALDPGGAAHGAEEHLAAVRALAPHAKLPAARDALVRALSSPPVEVDAGPLSEWVQSASALALAKTQDPAALSALGRALRKPGHAAELTRAALLANPPRDLAPILRAPGAPTKELCEALGELGDLRAEPFLRDVVRRGAPDARAAAALALLRFGSSEVVELARHWLKAERQPVLVAAADEILARRGTADAAAALTELAGNEATRQLALGLFLLTDGSVPAPAALEPDMAGERAPQLLERRCLGRAPARTRLARPDQCRAGDLRFVARPGSASTRPARAGGDGAAAAGARAARLGAAARPARRRRRGLEQAVARRASLRGAE